MPRGRQRSPQWRGRRLLPPIELLDPSDARRSEDGSVRQRRHHEGIVAVREQSKRVPIAMIVVVVTQQHRRNGRQVVEPHGRLSHAARSQDVERAGTRGIHRVGQNIPCAGLNQKGRMTDERDDGDCAIERGRALKRLVDASRPGRSPSAEHARHGRERQDGCAGRIRKSPAIEVIALLHSRVRPRRDSTRRAALKHARSGGRAYIILTRWWTTILRT